MLFTPGAAIDNERDEFVSDGKPSGEELHGTPRLRGRVPLNGDLHMNRCASSSGTRRVGGLERFLAAKWPARRTQHSVAIRRSAMRNPVMSGAVI